MSDLSNSSFIPKQGPVKKRRRSASKKVYVFTMLCYVAFFASLLGSAGVYFYGDLVDKQLEDEVVALNGEIGSFSQVNMQRVQEFDVRLQQANDRLNKSASIVSIFNSLEAATIDTVSLNSLSIERMGDDFFKMALNMNTDSFDSTLFQREVYTDNGAIGAISIESLVSSGLGESVGGSQDTDLQPEVTFIAEIEVPLNAVPLMPRSQSLVVEEENQGVGETDVSESEEFNQNEL
jgi:hypothetical protein